MQKTDFIQTGPELKNTYYSDGLLQAYLEKNFSAEYLKQAQDDLAKFGERCVTDIKAMADDCERNEPYLEQYDVWGNRIDQIITPQGWKQLDGVAAEEGIVAHGYRREFNEFSRMFQFMKLYLFHPSSAFYSCPLAMSDGAAKLIELSGDQELKAKAFAHLTSMDPGEFWTSGQWMTEKTGGSDVSRTETIARKQGEQYQLYGTKWFTSATTSQMTMALARIEDESGNCVAGSRGLSLFYIELRDSQQQLQNIEILRLKNKLGTKALPTAELRLNGTPAKLVGNIGEGVKTIANLFNVTRIYNSVTSCGAFRRVLDLAIDYSRKREAFKAKLQDHPLHVTNLAAQEVEFSSCFHLTFLVAKLLGDEECANTSELPLEHASNLLRLLTPITKLYTAKLCMAGTSELLESFGGNGYIEDAGISRLLRDNQVFSIWEGTTNVLSMDVLRAMQKENAFESLVIFLQKQMKQLQAEQLEHVTEEFQKLESFLKMAMQKDPLYLPTAARELAFAIGRLTAGVLMMNFANKTTRQYDQFCAQEFAKRAWCVFSDHDESKRALEREILFGK